MTRLARTSVLLFVLTMISAGCAQVPGSYTVVGEATPNGLVTPGWPQPTIDQSAAPAPREPTILPQATRPEEPQAKPDAARRSPAAPRRFTPPVRNATAPAASAPRDVWQRVRNGMQMRPVESTLVGDWETYYSSRPEYFARMIDNSAHFMYHIANEVEQRGIPLEIALLPMIESAYNPVAYSSAHAAGI